MVPPVSHRVTTETADGAHSHLRPTVAPSERDTRTSNRSTGRRERGHRRTRRATAVSPRGNCLASSAPLERRRHTIPRGRRSARAAWRAQLQRAAPIAQRLHRSARSLGQLTTIARAQQHPGLQDQRGDRQRVDAPRPLRARRGQRGSGRVAQANVADLRDVASIWRARLGAGGESEGRVSAQGWSPTPGGRSDCPLDCPLPGVPRRATLEPRGRKLPEAGDARTLRQLQQGAARMPARVQHVPACAEYAAQP